MHVPFVNGSHGNGPPAFSRRECGGAKLSRESRRSGSGQTFRQDELAACDDQALPLMNDEAEYLGRHWKSWS